MAHRAADANARPARGLSVRYVVFAWRPVRLVKAPAGAAAPWGHHDVPSILGLLQDSRVDREVMLTEKLEYLVSNRLLVSQACK